MMLYFVSVGTHRVLVCIDWLVVQRTCTKCLTVLDFVRFGTAPVQVILYCIYRPIPTLSLKLQWYHVVGVCQVLYSDLPVQITAMLEFLMFKFSSM